MKIGDTVTHINLVGKIIGVSSAGNPVVEWNDGEYNEHAPEELIAVELPMPNEELRPDDVEDDFDASSSAELKDILHD